jgi:hypothetical protein
MKQLLRSTREAFVQLQQKKIEPRARRQERLDSLKGLNPNSGALPVASLGSRLNLKAAHIHSAST